MKKGRMAITALAIIFIISSVAIVKVNASSYGLVQTSLSHFNDPWVFQISSDDPAVKHVTVFWQYSTYPPTLAILGTSFQTDQFDVNAPFSFSDQITPTNIGNHWAIVVEYISATGAIIHVENHEEEFTSTDGGVTPTPSPPSNTVPEVPLIGTIGVAMAMLFATVFYFKLKRPSLQKI